MKDYNLTLRNLRVSHTLSWFILGEGTTDFCFQGGSQTVTTVRAVTIVPQFM